MPISCVKNGNALIWKSMQQKIYIGTMFLILFIMILSPILSLVLYDVFDGYINNLCKDYGIDLGENNSGPAILSLSVLSIVSGILCLLSIRYYYSVSADTTDYITPFILFIVSAGSATGAALMSGGSETKDSGNVDPKIRNWCYESRSGATTIRGIIGGLLAIIIAGFISYLTALIGESCEIY